MTHNKRNANLKKKTPKNFLQDVFIRHIVIDMRLWCQYSSFYYYTYFTVSPRNIIGVNRVETYE